MESPPSQTCGVFDDDPSGADFTNNPGELCPEPAAFSFDSASFSGIAHILTWESTTNHIHGPVLIDELIRADTRTLTKLALTTRAPHFAFLILGFTVMHTAGELCDIPETRHIGPVLCQYAAAELVAFTLPYGLEVPGAFQTQLVATDTAEQ